MAAGRLGEAASLARIDLDQGQTRFGQPTLEGAAIDTGWLERDPSDRKVFEPSDQRRKSFGIVGELA